MTNYNEHKILGELKGLPTPNRDAKKREETRQLILAFDHEWSKHEKRKNRIRLITKGAIIAFALLLGFMFFTETGNYIATNIMEYFKGPDNPQVDTLPTEDHNQVEPIEEPEPVITEEQVLQEVQHFLDLVKNRDEAGLLKLYQERDYYDYYASFLSLEKMAKDTIEGFESIYDLNTMQISHFGENNYPDINQYHVVVTGSKHNVEQPIEHNIMVFYGGKSSNQGFSYHRGFGFHSSMITYFTRSKTIMEAYINSIKEKDVSRFARILTPDDVGYPIHLATKAIQNYEENANLQSLSYEYIGYDTESDNGFYYLIHDQEQLNNHQVKVYFGDGLISVDDSFVPKFDQSEWQTAEDAQTAMIRYAYAIAEIDAKVIAELYGGDYEWLEIFSPEEERKDKEKVIENYLKVLGEERFYFHQFVSGEKLAEEEYVYTITFRFEDGTLLSVGQEDNRNSEFRYTVKKIDGVFKVLEPPPYQP